MIRILKPTVAMSVQDQGRAGCRHLGHCRSGAMDPLSLRSTNRCAGAAADAAGIEMGPGPAVVRFERPLRIAFGGARRDGATWWTKIEVNAGDTIELSPPKEAVWSYLSVAGGIDAPTTFGSRSTCVREGIGSWVGAGDSFEVGDATSTPAQVDPPSMHGSVRIRGNLPGAWTVSARSDRMGYLLEGTPLPPGAGDEWSEPVLTGTIQLTPSGLPFVLMAEGSNAGGYPVLGYVESDDLRLLAQTPPGSPVTFTSV